MATNMKNSDIPWIGYIPSNWAVDKYKSVMKRHTEKNHPQAEVLSVYRDYGVIPKDSRDDNHNKTAEDTSSYIYVKKGDFVINKMKAWQGSMGVSEYNGIVSPAYYCYRFVSDKVFPKYLHYLLRNCYKDEFRRLSGGMREGQWDLPAYDLEHTMIVIPPIKEQSRIADYLDEKCTSIDAAIEAGEKEIEKLKAYKQSVIINAVTKGLNPDVEMKDSGIEWIGEYPRKWKLMPVKYLVTIRNGSDPKLEGNIPVYGSGTSSFKSCGEYKMGPAVLLGRKGSISIPNYVEGKYWNVDTAFDAKTKDHRLNLKFYYYCAVCFDYESYITQTTIPSMTQTDYGNMRIPFPERDEQEMIVKYLDQKVSEISGMIKIKQDQVEKLNAYKKSVIYTYVTGKKEVPNG